MKQIQAFLLGLFSDAETPFTNPKFRELTYGLTTDESLALFRYYANGSYVRHFFKNIF